MKNKFSLENQITESKFDQFKKESIKALFSIWDASYRRRNHAEQEFRSVLKGMALFFRCK